MSFKNIVITKSNISSSTPKKIDSQINFNSFLKKRRFESFIKKKPQTIPSKNSQLQKHFLQLLQNRNNQKRIKKNVNKKITEPKTNQKMDLNKNGIEESLSPKYIDKNIVTAQYVEKNIKEKGGKNNDVIKKSSSKIDSKLNIKNKSFKNRRSKNKSLSRKKMSRRRSISFTVLSSKNQHRTKIRENKIMQNIQNMDVNKLRKYLIKHNLIKEKSKAPENMLREIAKNLFTDK